jgi:glycosyltransferase involved in cell wall biosynthesis
MNILFVIDFYQPHIGGVEKLFSSLIDELAKNGNNITCITWRYDKKLSSKEIINGTKVIRIWSPARMVFSLIALPVIIKEARKHDLIHTSTYSAAVGARIAEKITRKKLIVTVHEVWGKLWFKLPYLTWFEKLAFRTFEKWLLNLNFENYVTVSDFTTDRLVEMGISNNKITRIYNGIDYNLPQWRNPLHPFTFTYFGRTGSSKGLDLLVSASERISKKYPEIHFKFILSLQSKRIFRSITLRIKKGILNNTTSIFTNLDYSELISEFITSPCIVVPSYCEGFGFTAVEAAAMNIPLISSGKGALKEVVSGKVITFDELSVSSLYRAMEAALNNQFSEIPIKKFGIEEFIEKHISLYKKVIS